MSINSARPHVGDASKTCPKDPPTECNGGKPPAPDLASYVEQAVAQAPPLTMSQLNRLALVLNTTRPSGTDAAPSVAGAA